jgi:LEA14-like dessication related protein
MQVVLWPLLCLLIAGKIIISGCTALVKSPEVSVTDVALSSVALSELSLDVNLLVNNLNSFGITLKSLSFDVFYENGNDWVYLSHGEKTRIRIEPGENEVTVPVSVSNAELLKSLAGFITSGKISLRVRGTISPDFYGIAPNVPFTYTTAVTL